jgi:hypothetical protein
MRRYEVVLAAAAKQLPPGRHLGARPFGRRRLLSAAEVSAEARLLHDKSD